MHCKDVIIIPKLMSAVHWNHTWYTRWISHFLDDRHIKYLAAQNFKIYSFPPSISLYNIIRCSCQQTALYIMQSHFLLGYFLYLSLISR